MAVNQIANNLPDQALPDESGRVLDSTSATGTISCCWTARGGGFLEEMECSLKRGCARAETSRRYLGCLLPDSNVLITKRSNLKDDALCED